MGEDADVRVAAIYDIHANLPALEAALAAIDASDVDLTVVGGDIAWGPMPRETMERLLVHPRRCRPRRRRGRRRGEQVVPRAADRRAARVPGGAAGAARPRHRR